MALETVGSSPIIHPIVNTHKGPESLWVFSFYVSLSALGTLAFFFFTAKTEQIRLPPGLAPLRQFHMANEAVVYIYLLHSFFPLILPVMHHNLVNELPEDFRDQNLNIGVFPYQPEESLGVQLMLLLLRHHFFSCAGCAESARPAHPRISQTTS